MSSTRIFAKPRSRRPVSMGATQTLDFAMPQNRSTICGAPMDWESAFQPVFATDEMEIDPARPTTRDTMDWRPQTRDTMDWRPTTSHTMDWRPSTRQGADNAGLLNPGVARQCAAPPAPQDGLDDLAASLACFPTEANGRTEKGVHGKFRKLFRPFLRR